MNWGSQWSIPTIIPIYGQPDVPERSELDREILRVLESTLQLDSIACRETVLHGLGHWQHYYPQRVGEIIDAFLRSHRVLRKELETYAVNAYTGYVL